MNDMKRILMAALVPIALAACSEVATPVTGKTESLPPGARPEKTDVSAVPIPSAKQAVGREPTTAPKAPQSTADMAKDLTKKEESNSMPMAGHGNNHSIPDSAPAKKPSGS
jgi:hypothetical protein